jgi:uncharacterized protein YdhG (YjbR/CyaY superfamily)
MNEVDEYIAEFPADTQIKLEQVHRIIKSVAPNLTESLK